MTAPDPAQNPAIRAYAAYANRAISKEGPGRAVSIYQAANAARRVDRQQGEFYYRLMTQPHRLLAALCIQPARDPNYIIAWSRWRRLHPAAARYDHYRRRITDP